ncbi:MAG TPA: hypothetical protein VIC34_08420 [Croceibacterium sp.]|jgi:hypothetical protein
MSHPLRTIHTQALDFWFARSSVVLIVALQVLVINKLSLGPRWLAPALEVALLAPLSFVTAWTQSQAREATTDHHWATVARRRRIIRGMAVALTILVTVMNFASLLYLVKALLGGHSGNSGQTLLLDALNIWATNVIAFALWFWNIDRGGPASQGLTPVDKDDFLFPQMTIPQCEEWSPGFIDYLYISFTNATAFSPTDTMPLSRRAKVLMAAEAGISLLTIALVGARAVNILA